MTDLWNSSPVGRLLEEISWEGSSVRAYRDGGRGRENVLTVEALMLLDFLPRDAFLGGVIRQAEGADAVRDKLVSEVEAATLTMLPDETRLKDGTVVQPDAIIETPSVYALIEAKRIRSSSFQTQQLARERDAMFQTAGDREPILFLILGAPPPVTVKGRGKMSLVDAVSLGRAAPLPPPENMDRHVAWTTWDEIHVSATRTAQSLVGTSSGDVTIRRLATALVRTIDWHR